MIGCETGTVAFALETITGEGVLLAAPLSKTEAAVVTGGGFEGGERSAESKDEAEGGFWLVVIQADLETTAGLFMAVAELLAALAGAVEFWLLLRTVCCDDLEEEMTD